MENLEIIPYILDNQYHKMIQNDAMNLRDFITNRKCNINYILDPFKTISISAPLIIVVLLAILSEISGIGSILLIIGTYIVSSDSSFT